MFLPYAFRELAGAGTLAASAECGTSTACWRCRCRQETLSQLVAAHLSCWADSKQSKGATSYELVPPRTGFPYKARSFKEDNLKILKKYDCSNFGNLAFLLFASRQGETLLNDAWSIPLSSPFPPGKLVGEGTFLSLRKRKKGKYRYGALRLVIAYQG